MESVPDPKICIHDDEVMKHGDLLTFYTNHYTVPRHLSNSTNTSTPRKPDH